MKKAESKGGVGEKKTTPDKFNLQGATASAFRQAYISITHMIEQAIHHTYSGEAEEMSGRGEGRLQWRWERCI